MTFQTKHILDVVFEECALDNGEAGVKMVVFTDIDPHPTTDEGKRALADLMGEIEVHKRHQPRIRQVRVIKEP